jgi:hypothetical protein
MAVARDGMRAIPIIHPAAPVVDGYRQTGVNARWSPPILQIEERSMTSCVEQGDHHIVVGEVVEAHLNKPLSGRPDAAILEMKDLGDNVFYGG